MKIDWKKELSMPKLRRPVRRRPGGATGEKASRRPFGSAPRVPKPLADLYADLRDRHLLPVVGLLVAVMIAAPILLSNKGGKEEEVPPVASAAAGAGQASNATFDVVPAGTSLRDYKKRLGHRQAVNPFRGSSGVALGASSGGGSEAGTAEPASGQESDRSSGTEEAVSGTTETAESVVKTTVGGVTTEVAEGAPEPAERGHDAKEAKSGPKAKEGSPTKPKRHRESGAAEEAPATPTPSEPTKPAAPQEPAEPTKPAEPEKPAETEKPAEAQAPQVVVGYTINAETGFLPHASERTDIAPLTKLPNAKHPVVVFMGLSQDHKRALFLMTGEVTAWYGGHCVLEHQACQLIEVGLRKGASFAYGYGDSRYKVRVKKISPIFAGRSTLSHR